VRGTGRIRQGAEQDHPGPRWGGICRAVDTPAPIYRLDTTCRAMATHRAKRNLMNGRCKSDDPGQPFCSKTSEESAT